MRDEGLAFPMPSFLLKTVIEGVEDCVQDEVKRAELIEKISATSCGMTLRDYFAGQVLLSLAMHEEYPPTRAAKAAYDYADCMMRARQE